MNIYGAWKGILIHHSAVNDDVILSDFEAIRRFHTSWRLGSNIISEAEAKEMIKSGMSGIVAPWRDIGYHMVTELVDKKPVTRNGRPLWMRGAHEPKVNGTHIGYCFVGNFDIHRPPDWMYHEGARKIAELIKLCPNISLNMIEPHNKYSQKTCPGKLFCMETLVDRVRFFLRN